MALPISAVQQALKNDGIDGWLLYDFHGLNPIATRLTDLAASSKMATRRWYYLVPAEGAPRGLVHAIERHNLDGLPGEKRPYAGREQLADGLKDLLRGMKRVAMEYSPGNAIPYVSRVDAGTVEAVRELGVDVVSSGDLVQRFEAIWSDEALVTHRAASERLYRIKDRAFQLVKERVRQGLSEFEVQQAMVGWFAEEGLISDSAPVVQPRRMPATRTISLRRRRLGQSEPMKWCCSTSGASLPRRARSLLTSLGWGLRVRSCRRNTRKCLPPSAMDATQA